MDAATIASIEAFCFRFPLAQAVTTSFGRMTDRPAVFVRVRDRDGIEGWGEIWCNFPSVGAEHRVRLVREILAPLLVGASAAHPSEIFSIATTKTSVLALQSGEHGPFAQAIAGIDIAIWDLFARRARQPLWRFLGGGERVVRVYASGVNPTGARETVAAALSRGHRAFKQKIGFARDRDISNLSDVRREIGDLPLAADANQAWSVEEARARISDLASFELRWLEEPVRADVSWALWRQLITSDAPPLAAGENLASMEAFADAIGSNVLQIIQPDIAKWGGFTRCIDVARQALAAGRIYCPHYLGGGVGLLASAHLLAAVGGDGMLEVDINPNPLRDLCCGAVAHVKDGMVELDEEPGLGLAPDLARFADWRSV